MTVIELNKIVKKYDTKIYPSKIKPVGFYGKNIKRVKLNIEGKIIEPVSNFNYLGYLISNADSNISISSSINLSCDRSIASSKVLERDCPGKVIMW
jgi:hypothetical protein